MLKSNKPWFAILHFFCGRRRFADREHELHQAFADVSNVCIVALSIDVTIDSVQGDLSAQGHVELYTWSLKVRR